MCGNKCLKCTCLSSNSDKGVSDSKYLYIVLSAMTLAYESLLLYFKMQDFEVFTSPNIIVI